MNFHLVVPTNDGSSQSTETRPVTPTPFDHHIPSRSLETSVISTKRTTAEPRTTSTVPTTTTPLPSSATRPRPRHPIFVSCDTRSSGCSFVYLRIQPTQVPVSCRVTNVKVKTPIRPSGVFHPDACLDDVIISTASLSANFDSVISLIVCLSI